MIFLTGAAAAALFLLIIFHFTTKHTPMIKKIKAEDAKAATQAGNKFAIDSLLKIIYESIEFQMCLENTDPVVRHSMFKTEGKRPIHKLPIQ